MIIEIFPARHVAGKLADAALRFEPGEPLAGLTLTGFQIWEPRDGNPAPSITFPARMWMNGGKAIPVVLLRDARTDKFTDAPESVALKVALLAAYDAKVAPKGPRKAALVRAGQRAAAAPIAPPAAPRRVLRPRVAVARGTVTHRIAEAQP